MSEGFLPGEERLLDAAAHVVASAERSIEGIAAEAKKAAAVAVQVGAEEVYAVVQRAADGLSGQALALSGTAARMEACGQRAVNDMRQALSSLEGGLDLVRKESAALSWRRSVVPILAALAGAAAALIVVAGGSGLVWGWYSHKLAGLQAQVRSAEAAVAELSKGGGKLTLKRCGKPGERTRLCVAAVVDGSGKPQVWRDGDTRAYVVPEGY